MKITQACKKFFAGSTAFLLLFQMSMFGALVPNVAEAGQQDTIMVSATVNPTTGGSVSGTGVYPKNSNVSLTANFNVGFIFSRWTGCSTSSSPNIELNHVNKDTECVANFVSSALYTVTFDSNAGSVVSAITGVASGTNISAPTAPTKTGYTFVGWYKDEALTDDWFFSVDTVTGNTTLYAKWTINSYTVKFDSDGGTDVNQQTVFYNGLATEPTNVPTKQNFNFIGWFYGNAWDTQWEFATNKVTENITLKAKWTKNYILSYDANGGSGEPDDSVYKDGTIATVSSAIPQRVGYSFVEWNTMANGNGISYIPLSTLTVTNNVILYAQWVSNAYTVSFDSKGGSSVESTSVLFGNTFAEPTPPTRTGFEFAGWFSDSGLTNSWDFTTDVVTENIVLYAKWLDIEAPVITVDPLNVKITQGSTFEIMSGVSAVDNLDGSVVVITTGTVNAGISGNYFIHYNAKDTAGNAAEEVIRKIEVEKTKNPSIVVDPAIIEIEVYSEYGVVDSMNGVSAESYSNKDITSSVLTDISELDTDTVGTYTVTYTVTDDHNNSSEASRTVIVKPRVIKVSATSSSKVYGTDDPLELAYTYIGKIEEGDSFSGKLHRDGDENVGTYEITQGDLDLGSNYDLQFTKGTFEIKKASITVTINPSTKVYGASDPEFTYIPGSGYVDGDSLSVEWVRDAGENVGDYVVNASVANKNYDITVVPSKLTITPAQLTITADAKTKVEGAVDPTLTYTVDGLLGTDKLSGALARVSGETPGTFQILVGTVTAGDNYKLTYKPADLTITPAPSVPATTATTGTTGGGNASVATPTGNDQAVQGAQTENTQANQNTPNNQGVKGAENTNQNTTWFAGKFLGLERWIWLVVVLALGFFWWFIAWKKRKKDDK